MAFGSGKVAADLMRGRSPNIRSDELGLVRYANDSFSRLSEAREDVISN